MDVIAETPTIPVEPLPRQYFITKENAQALRERAIEAKKRNKLALEQRLQSAETQARIALPLIEAAVASSVQDSASYVSQRLSRTRSQIEALDAQLLASDDPRAIQAISVAIRNLAEIERVLAGRPLPGSRRPGREKPARGPVTGGSLMADE